MSMYVCLIKSESLAWKTLGKTIAKDQICYMLESKVCQIIYKVLMLCAVIRTTKQCNYCFRSPQTGTFIKWSSNGPEFDPTHPIVLGLGLAFSPWTKVLKWNMV